MGVHGPTTQNSSSHGVSYGASYALSAKSVTHTEYTDPTEKPGAFKTPAKKLVKSNDQSPSKTTESTRFCVYCQQQKVWIFRGDKAKDGSKIYTDAQGSRWAGKRCPDCEKKRVKAANKHDYFERTSIVQKLKASGYKVVSTSSPMIVEKDGEYSTVGIQRAFTSADGRIVVEDPTEASEKTQLVALLFQTTKLVSRKQLAMLEHKLEPFTPATGDS